MILRITGRLFNIHVLDHEFLNRFSMILFLLMKYFYFNLQHFGNNYELFSEI